MSTKCDILIVEDDADLAELISVYLINSGYSVELLNDPTKVLDRLEEVQCKLLLMDLTLPKMDGLVLCEAVRKLYTFPIIIMSARDQVSDKVLGLERGADDYIPKPFDSRELVARIQAQLRRHDNAAEKSEIFETGEFKVDKVAMKIYQNDQLLELTVAEFGILELFLENRGMVFSRDQILDHVRGMSWNSSERSIDVIVSRIRTKLGDNPRKPIYIESIRGVGYRMS